VATPEVWLAWLLYGVHMASLPFWLYASLGALRKQRQRGAGLPTEGEFFGVRLLLIYALSDFVRGLDLCFDGTDGACRAVWGVVPLSLRLGAWALRDVALLGAIGLNIEFILGWTYAALGWRHPAKERLLVRLGFAITLCGLCGSLWGLAATNRQSWQSAAALFVVLLNAVWARANMLLLRHSLPELEMRHRNLSLGSVVGVLAESDAPARNGLVATAPVVWAAAQVAEARLTARLVLTANLFILVVFPIIASDRLMKGAHNRPFIQGAPLGAWVGGAVAPRLEDLPLGISLIPALEMVELLIGWLQLVYVRGVGSKVALARAPAGEPSEESGWRPCGYISYARLGRAMQELSDGGLKMD